MRWGAAWSDAGLNFNEGQTAIEYMLVILLIALVLFFAFQAATNETLREAIIFGSENLAAAIMNLVAPS